MKLKPDLSPPIFDEKIYLAANPDIANALSRGEISSGLEHYEKHGIHESRIVNLDQLLFQTTLIRQALLKGERRIAYLEDSRKSTQSHEVQLIREHASYRQSLTWLIVSPFHEGINHFRNTTIFKYFCIYQSYRKRYPGVDGLYRLVNKSINALLKGHDQLQRNLAVQGNISTHEMYNLTSSQTGANTFFKKIAADKSGVLSIRMLKDFFENNYIDNLITIFDHNGGGGSNAYTQRLIKESIAKSKTTLRVYCVDAIWFIQLINDKLDLIFYTKSIDELFDVILDAKSKEIIVNSVYGYPNISEWVGKLAMLSGASKAFVEIKVHDFNALCSSPHLLNYEDKYCNVPDDHKKCELCLKKNHHWFHSWYPEENKPLNINEWRRPFEELFSVANCITFFDQSSLGIVKKGFTLDESKVAIIPHSIEGVKAKGLINPLAPLHIGVLGTLTIGKGGDIVNKLCKYVTQHNLSIPITLVGSSIVAVEPQISVYGPYVADELPEIIHSQGINVILMPSIVPETFSYTLSEAIQMGLPIVTFDIGAQGSRVKEYSLGKVVPPDSAVEEILNAVQSVFINSRELKS